MAEYIEREAAIKNIKEHQCRNCSDIGLCENCAVLTAIKLFESIPATDVQPVKHGQWFQDAVYVDETTGEPCLAWFCNQCGEPQIVGTNYCPNCGATMDGET